MKIEILTVTARSASFEIEQSTCYYSSMVYQVKVNGETALRQQNRNVFSLFHLYPAKEYLVEVVMGEETFGVSFTTKQETAFINVRRYGATGDGITDDTLYIQAALMACPAGGTVYMPEGTYLCTSLFLTNEVTLYLDEGCTILGQTDRTRYPILPGVNPGSDEGHEYYLGSWEGNPLDCFAGLINIIGASKVSVTGQGKIDAQAQNGDWYIEAKKKRIAWRPRLFFTSQAKQVLLHGVTVTNSYSWTIHLMFSDNVDLIDVCIWNDPDSPNTDGVDPESCRNVRIIGTRIHVGDDCIALKSGKLFMARKFKRPCENILIKNCLLERGHGGLSLGSEMSGGAKNIYLTHCIMKNTDRGLRIKTRRGRGRDAVVSQLTFNDVEMDAVKAPFVVNMFYCCDPDGNSDYVQDRNPLPVDERTPELEEFTFERIRVSNAEYAGCYFLGLPEQPIRKITLNDVEIGFAENAQAGCAVMAGRIGETKKLAFYAKNVREITLNHVTFTGYEGECIQIENVDRFEEVQL